MPDWDRTCFEHNCTEQPDAALQAYEAALQARKFTDDVLAFLALSGWDDDEWYDSPSDVH